MNIINTLMPNFERLAEEFYECLYQTVTGGGFRGNSGCYPFRRNHA